jgi:hypothetical protein
MEQAARQTFAERHPDVEPDEITLVQVVDRPGTDEDKAVFRFDAEGEHWHVTLGRRAGAWVGERFE